MNRCPACGSTYADEARFCTRDGAPLTPIADIAARPWLKSVRNPGPTAPTPRATSLVATPGPHADLVGQALQSRYRIVKKIGEGGMSVVYLAIDVATDEPCAIKVLSSTLSRDENAMARLRREASLGMRLPHPNICHIMRLGETENGLVFVVMPLLEGELLSDRTNRVGQMSATETGSIARDIANGLHAAHELKIVHRDLKPENVMVCRRSNGEEVAVVMDFGLAKERRADTEHHRLTAKGIILGTPEFMSPEQVRGKPLDGRTDIYALGLIVFEMLTGKLPFQGRTQQQVMIARLRTDPTPLRSVRPDLPYAGEIERVLLKALTREPEDRYQTAPEFADAFIAAAAGRSRTTAGSNESRLLGKLFGR